MTDTLTTGLTAAFTGDICAPDRFPNERREISPSFNPLSRVLPWLQAADLVVANLEGPLGIEGTARPGRGAILHNHERVLSWFSPIAQPIFCLANNHIMDYGELGLRRTLEQLRCAGFGFFGAGLNEADALRPHFVSSAGSTYGFLAFTSEERHVGSVCADGPKPGAANLFSPGAMDAIASLVRHSDHASVLLHWGREFFDFPSPDQIAMVKRIAALGVGAIICHHPHVVNGVHYIGKTLVAHSLGNCVFPEFRQTNGRRRLQSSAERRFLLLRSRLVPGSQGAYEMLHGACRNDGSLVADHGPGARRYRLAIDALSAPLDRPDYEAFYRAYASRQTRRLRWREIFFSIRKLLQVDPRTITRSDLKRAFLRFNRAESASRRQNSAIPQ